MGVEQGGRRLRTSRYLGRKRTARTVDQVDSRQGHLNSPSKAGLGRIGSPAGVVSASAEVQDIDGLEEESR